MTDRIKIMEWERVREVIATMPCDCPSGVKGIHFEDCDRKSLYRRFLAALEAAAVTVTREELARRLHDAHQASYTRNDPDCKAIPWDDKGGPKVGSWFHDAWLAAADAILALLRGKGE